MKIQGERRIARKPSPTTPVRALMATSETPKRTPAARAEHDAVVMVGGAEARAADQQGADHEHRGLEGDHARERVRGVRAGRGRQRDDEEEEAGGGHGDADPLAQRRP